MYPIATTDARIDAACSRHNETTAARARSSANREAGLRVDAKHDGDSPWVSGLVRAWKIQAEQRGDAFDPSASLFKARELEHIVAEIFREEFPALSGLDFPVDTSIPVGARTYTLRRWYGAGQPSEYRAGREIPTIALGSAEESFNIRHFVIADEYDIFDLQSADFANYARIAEGLREMNDAHLRAANARTWFGSSESKLYGVLNYPWVNKYVESQPIRAGQAGTAIVAALHRIASFPSDNSRGVMSPNAMKMGNRLYNFISQTTFDTNAGTDTILEVFLRQSRFIQTVQPAEELDGTGPGGTDIIVAYRNDRLGVRNAIVQMPALLPVDTSGVERRQIMYMTHGGVTMPNVANNIIAYVDGPASA